MNGGGPDWQVRARRLAATVLIVAIAACVASLGNNADASLEIDGVRVRINAFEHLGGAAIAARLILIISAVVIAVVALVVAAVQARRHRW